MTEQTEHDDPPMSLVAHLTELRDRLLRAVLAVLIGFIILFPFANEIYGFVSAPLRELMPEGSTMIATGVASPFLTPFKLSLVLAIFMAIPVILYQIWGFVAPGLYQKEKRIALPLLASSVLLFYAGAAFAYFVVFPLIFAFFTSVGPESVQVMTDINSYLDFVLKLFLAFGIAFEMPIAAVILIWTGVTSPDALAKKRPYIIVGCFIFGMLLTPPDVISQSLLAIPMWLLFELGVFFGRLLEPKAQRAMRPWRTEHAVAKISLSILTAILLGLAAIPQMCILKCLSLLPAQKPRKHRPVIGNRSFSHLLLARGIDPLTIEIRLLLPYPQKKLLTHLQNRTEVKQVAAGLVVLEIHVQPFGAKRSTAFQAAPVQIQLRIPL